jgi:alpha-D-ribose 1-methylphosphonate 5-triphosphate synthase subunit PhnH
MKPGLLDPVHDAQRSFRAALQALARPGLAQPLGQQVPGVALGPALAHLLLALTDESTPVWWQRPEPGLEQWLRFHTGARTTAQPGEAAFAVVTAPASMPALDLFAQGSLAAPEFSTTLLVEVASLGEGPAVRAHGPGIQGSQGLRLAGLRDRFWAEWQANHAAFPQGVDVLFTCGGQALGLPRTTRISRLQEV